MNGGTYSPGVDKPCEQDRLDKNQKKLIRKEIKKTLAKLLETSLLEDKYNRNPKCISKQPEEQSLSESISVYGILTNSVTKESDLIFSADANYKNGTKFVYYTVSNKNLFKSFPTAGTYLAPFTSCKPVFIEVLAQVDDFYICRPVNHLRYLELLSMKGE